MTDTHDWMWETSWGRLIRRVISFFVPLLAFIATLWIIQEIERRFFPVISQWTLDYIDRRGDYLVMGGKLYKSRTCELVNTLVVGVPKNSLSPRVLIHQVSPSELTGADVTVGLHMWGPWEIRIPAILQQYKDQIGGIEIVGRHRCHVLWMQETVYGFVPIEKVPL